MNPISRRTQLALIAAGYILVLACGACVLYLRHLEEASHPADVMASSGMYAFGDALLVMFLAFALLIPTAFLLWFLSKFGTLYTVYSKVLLAISLSAPISLGLFNISRNAQFLNLLCFMRLWWSPFMLAIIGLSRLVARIDRTKRLTSWALLIEGVTLGITVALLIHIGSRPR